MMLWNTTNCSYNDLGLPDDVHVTRISASQTRVVHPTTNKEWVRDIVTGQLFEALPDSVDVTVLPQVTLHQDSGSVNRGGFFYLSNHMKLNIFGHWGKIHGAVRDTTLSVERALNGDAQRAQLGITHVFSLHSKPFGSGVWHQTLKAAQDNFRLLRGHTDPEFRFYGELWARDLRAVGIEISLNSESDWEALFQRFLELWTAKISAVKKMRWWCSHQKHVERGTDFWPFKMLLRHHNGSTSVRPSESYEDPVLVARSTPAKELAALKAKNSGLKVGEKVLTHWTHFFARAYFYTTRATWAWHGHQRTKVKSSIDALRQFVENSRGGWMVEINGLIVDSLRTERHLYDMGIVDGTSQSVVAYRCNAVVNLLVEQMGNRMMTKLEGEFPPFSWSGLLTDSDHYIAHAKREISVDTIVLRDLENAQSSSAVRELLDDIYSNLFPVPVKLAMFSYQVVACVFWDELY